MKLFPGRCQEFRVTRARFESLDWVESAGLLRALLLGTAIGKGVKETPCTNSLRLNIAYRDLQSREHALSEVSVTALLHPQGASEREEQAG